MEPVIRRFSPDRESHRDDFTRRRELDRGNRRRRKAEAQLLGENAPEAVWRIGGLRGFVRPVSRDVVAVVRFRRREPSVVSLRGGNQANRDGVSVMYPSGSRWKMDGRRPASPHQQRLQEKSAGRNEAHDNTRAFASDRLLDHPTHFTRSYPLQPAPGRSGFPSLPYAIRATKPCDGSIVTRPIGTAQQMLPHTQRSSRQSRSEAASSPPIER